MYMDSRIRRTDVCTWTRVNGFMGSKDKLKRRSRLLRRPQIRFSVRAKIGRCNVGGWEGPKCCGVHAARITAATSGTVR